MKIKQKGVDVFKVMIIGLIINTSLSFSQQVNRCFTDEYWEQQVNNDQSLLDSLQVYEDNYVEFVNTYERSTGPDKRVIPVVVHIIYHEDYENISDAQIYSQIDVLNEDFRRLNSDTALTRSQFLDVVADCNVEFRLAEIDPSGNFTNGITRILTDSIIFTPGLDNMKYNSSGGHDAWATDQYLNLWVCNLGASVLGYAQLPWAGFYGTDGVVIDYFAFGSGDEFKLKPNYNLGRTTTHEIGHWLGLWHTFQEETCSNNDCLVNGDRVCDTPPIFDESTGCDHNKNTCYSDTPDLPDQVENYMDYSYDNCMNMLTIGQEDRINNTLNSERESFLNPNLLSVNSFDSMTGQTISLTNNHVITLHWQIESASLESWDWGSITPDTGSIEPGVIIYLDALFDDNCSLFIRDHEIIINTEEGIRKSVAIVQPPPAFLTIDFNGDAMSFSSSGGSSQFILTNTSPWQIISWNITNNNNWISVTPSSGVLGSFANETINVSVTSVNEQGGFGREASFEIQSSCGLAEMVTIQQEGNLNAKAALWTINTQNTIVPEPVIAPNGNINIITESGKLIRINSNGQQLWEFNPGNQYNSKCSPAIDADGIIYYTVWNWYDSNITESIIYAIRSNGTEKWSKILPNIELHKTYVTVSDNEVIFFFNHNIYSGGLHTNNSLLKLDKETGNTIWSEDVSFYTYGSLQPQVMAENDLIYLFSKTELLKYDNGVIANGWPVSVNSETSPVLSGNGTVYIDDNNSLKAFLSSGELNWEYSFTGGGQITPIIYENGDILSSSEEQLILLNQSGNEIWSNYIGQNPIGSPLIDSYNNIYLKTDENALVSISETGDLNWVYQTTNPIVSSPILHPNGYILITTEDGILHAIETDGANTLANTPWPCYQQNSQHTGLSPNKVVELWNKDYNNGNLSGTLTLDNLETTDIDFSEIHSGTEVLAFPGPIYSLKTDSVVIQNKWHHAYLNHTDWYKIEQNVYFDDQVNYTALFKEKDPVIITSIFGNEFSLKVHDPWYLEPQGSTNTGEQLDHFHKLTDDPNTYNLQTGQYNVFLDQDPDPGNPNKPYYRLKAPQLYATENAIYEFNVWGGTNVSYSNANNRVTKVVFEAAGATTTAKYTQVNQIENYTLTVPEEESLIIPSDAVIDFASGFTIDVGGELVVNGTADQPVTLFCSDGGQWGGVRSNVDNIFSEISLNYAEIYNAQVAVDLTIFSSVSLNNSTFYGSVKLDDLYYPEIPSGINIQDCSFYGIQDAAVEIESLSRSLTVEGTTFTNVGTGIKIDGIMTGGDAEFNSLEINANYAGIHFIGPIAEENHIVRVKNSLIAGIEGNGYGVLCDSIDFWNNLTSNRIQLQNVTITNNAQGLELIYSNGNPNQHFKDVQVKNCIIWGNSENISNADIANSSISYSDVPGSNSAYGNIQTDPNFVNPQNGDYHLSYPSPAIDAGDPNSPNDPDDTLADMGAFYYEMPSVHIFFDPNMQVGQPPVFQWLPVEIDGTEIYYDIYYHYGDERYINFLTTTQNTSYTDIRYIVVEIEESVNDDGMSARRIKVNPEPVAQGGSTNIYYVVKVRDGNEHQSPNSNAIHARVTRNMTRKELIENSIPDEFALNTAYPNPFNPAITLPYAIPELSTVTIMVYDITGRRVATLINQMEEAGYYQLHWNGRNKENHSLSSGMYIIQMTAKSMEDGDLFTKAQKVVLLK